MGKTGLRPAAILTLTFLFAVILHGAFEEDMLLKVAFDKREGLNATLAKGDPKGEKLAGGAITVGWEDETPYEGYEGYALFTGGTDQGMSFSAKDNIQADRGTITFWVKGRSWDLLGARRDLFFVLEAEDGSVELFQRKGKMVFVRRSGKSSRTLEVELGDFKPDAPHHIAVTFEKEDVKVYVDAALFARMGNFPFRRDFKRIIIGQRGPGDKPDHLIDNFTIYRRPLGPGEVKWAMYDESKIAPERAASVIRTARPIKIDGAIGEEEWRDATVLTGLLRCGEGLLMPGPRDLALTQSRIYLTYNDEYLFVALESPFPEAVRRAVRSGTDARRFLKSTRGMHDTEVAADDCFEINVVVPPLGGDTYRLLVNGINTRYDSLAGGRAEGSIFKGEDITWDPKWKTASAVDIDGWHVEAAIPFSDIGRGGPQKGTVWGMNFARVWKALQSQNDYWSRGYRTSVEGELHPGAQYGGVPGEIEFSGDEGIAVRLDAIEGPQGGRFDIRGSVRNSFRSARSVEINLRSDTGEVRQSRIITLAPSGARSFRIRTAFADPSIGSFFFKVTDLQSKRDVYAMEMPVLLHRRIEVRKRDYPSAGILKLEVAIGPLSEISLRKATFVAKVRNREDEEILEEQIKGLTNYEFEVELPTDRLEPGSYKVEVFLKKGWRTSWKKELSYEKKPLPEWYDNDIGLTDKIPYPFTPVSVSENSVGVWGRTYDFGEGLFPLSIKTGGFEILRSPISLKLKAADGNLIDVEKQKAETRWLMKTPARIECSRKVQLNVAEIENNFWTEYDGFIWSKLKITPQRPFTIEKLVLEVPFTKQFSDCINPYDYSLRETGKLKPDGWQGQFRPVWVGGAYGGLQWLADNDVFWHVKDIRKELRVENGPDGATMSITFIDKPLEIDGPYELEFGFIATPVKARNAEHRQWLSAAARYSFGGAVRYAASQEDFVPACESWYSRDFIIPADGRRDADWIVRRRKFMAPVADTSLLNTGVEYFDRFGDEWLRDERPGTAPLKIVRATLGAKSYRDFYIWRYWKLMQQAPFAALYYDGNRDQATAKRTSGIGVMKDGALFPKYTILAHRELAKRMYQMIKLRYPEGIIRAESSGGYNGAYLGFYDQITDGKNFASRLNRKQKNYHGILRPDTFRAEYMGVNFGPTTMFLPQLQQIQTYESMRKAGPADLDHICGLVLLHDSNVLQINAPGPYWERMRKALERLEWGNKYKMIPYWQQQVVKVPFKDFYASFYVESAGRNEKAIDASGFYYSRIKGPARRVICIFCNESDFAGEVSLKLDWKKIGFESAEGIAPENAVHAFDIRFKDFSRDDFQYVSNQKEEPRIEKGELKFVISSWNYRMIVLQGKEK